MKNNLLEQSDVTEDRLDLIGLKIEKYGYIKEAPDLREQMHDARDTLILSNISNNCLLHKTSAEESSIEYPEHESLNALYEFLTNASMDDSLAEPIRMEAQAMSDNLNFIGTKELEEAASGLAAYYKHWLESDIKNQLVIKLMSETGGDSTGCSMKSDIFVLDKIMSNFSESDREKYAGRLLRNLEDATTEPENIKAVILDDWSISGEQMMHVNYLSDFEHGVSVKPEINLIIAKKQFIEDGFNYHAYGSRDLDDGVERFEVKSYYVAKEDERLKSDEGSSGSARITGYYSSVDYGFEFEIAKMVSQSNKSLSMPPLTNIIRPYRSKGYRPENVIRMFS